ncbi:hypothetical protein A7A76_07670 [Lysobacter enzymogenes]|uniref:hypothetical protein n=1 Tax=Lysobacter enzymogenes TaxID=69 RepID=UPI0019D03AC8|nr:hypothetical protein [Lysobacter enzymogenes]MBN7138971.1 hypothetical protein [Lysobacter enzymogenes]
MSGGARGRLTAEQTNAMLAGLRLLQHFNDSTLIVTDRSGAARHFRMEEIAEVADESGCRLTNGEIDALCDALVAGEIA